MTSRCSTIVMRETAAISGLFLVVFVTAHLLGLIPAVLAPDAFERYASILHQAPWLPAVEIGILIATVLHISTTTIKSVKNKEAGNQAELVSRRESPLATFASRSKAFAGLITFGFLLIHLQQFRFHRPEPGLERFALSQVLHQPGSMALYALGSVAIGIHCFHGNEAAHRSLGLLNPYNKAWLRTTGRVLAVAIGGGFLSISLALALGATT